MNEEKIKAEVEQELTIYDKQQMELATLEQELQADPKFAQFLEARKSFAELEAKVWKHVEAVMIANNVKTMDIKTELHDIKLTIAERTNFDVDLELLPKKFIKRVPDTTLIGNTYKLTNKPVKGTTPKITKYLTKRIKNNG